MVQGMEKLKNNKEITIATFFGWLLMAIGVLIALGVGLCDIGLIYSGMRTAIRAKASIENILFELFADLSMILIFSGLPFLAGIYIYRFGKKLEKARKV